MIADTTAVLRAELTRRLASHLPPHWVAPAVDGVMRIARVPESVRSGTTASWVASQLRHVLPEPYRTAAEVLSAIVVPAVDAWLASRVVEVQAGVVTVTDRRG